MWMLKLKEGLEVTENELKHWDNVPQDVEISSLALGIQRDRGLPPFILHFEGYDQICCAKMASTTPGAPLVVGHAIYCVKGEDVNEIKVFSNGIKIRNYPIGKMTLKQSALRRMVS